MEINSPAARPGGPDLLSLTAEIVSAHVGSNTVPASDLPDLIRQVYLALNGTTTPVEPEQPAPAAPPPQKPAVQVSKSIFDSYIVCLEDGKKLKMLKRHLKTSYGLSPAQYRAKWGLPPEYPMVAPEYAKKRSSLAKAIGLGTRGKGAEPA